MLNGCSMSKLKIDVQFNIITECNLQIVKLKDNLFVCISANIIILSKKVLIMSIFQQLSKILKFKLIEINFNILTKI